ncbi:hypothetical protein SIO70_25690 [Chitinophaga sancti]|uniref:hypothetical protein n=1 Tax=Chitinophaga sancti TaxID=1004 RepID=UPI002A754D87|nr:hypothetical protein [Chitinophaga sancti]WPQ61758.1 hypothetical protein SIO70_25690 [Chitinophaga sancti]
MFQLFGGGFEEVGDFTFLLISLNVQNAQNIGIFKIPVHYLISYIIRHKHDYYRLLQQVRNNNDWALWLLFMLEAVAITAAENINTTIGIREVMQQYKKISAPTFLRNRWLKN